MAIDFLNRCKWSATSSGTGDFTVSAASTLFLTPSQAGATNALTYRYVAESTGNAEWEVGTGTYNSTATTSTTNVTVSRSSGNVEFSSNSNTIVAFTAAPTVRLGGPLATDMTWQIIGDTTVSTAVLSIEHSFNPGLYSELRTVVSLAENESDVAADGMSWGWQFQQSDGTVDLDKTQTISITTGSSSGHLGGTIRHYFSNNTATLWYGKAIYLFRSDVGVADSDTIISADLSGTTKIVYFFSDDGSDGSVTTASDTTAGRFTTYGLRLP